MSRTVALAVIGAALLASCAQEFRPSLSAELRANAWRARLGKELAPRSPSTAVEAYLRAHGALELTYSSDRTHLFASEPVELKRYFPPWPLRNSVRIDCSFSKDGALDRCLATPSAEACCSR